MNNDFIEGMEILIGCKKLVEDLIDENKYILESLEKRGADPKSINVIQNKINRYQDVLDGKKFRGYFREQLKEDF